MSKLIFYNKTLRLSLSLNIFSVYQLLCFFLRLDPNLSSCELSTSEKANAEEVERRGNKKLREASQDGTQTRKGKGGSSKGSKGSAKSHAQQR